MKLLVATPHLAAHWDAGLFWVKAFSSLGHTVLLWDYRSEPFDRETVKYFNPDATMVFKGEQINPAILPNPKVCYWPDAFDRTPDIDRILSMYDHVFTPCRPTPMNMTWMPSGWDPELHRDLNRERWINNIYVGTRNSHYKETMIKSLQPDGLAGNGWGKDLPPVYTENLVEYLNQGIVLINLHQNPQVGVNRKLFEMIACGLTVTDRAPGVDEILGQELASQVCFSTGAEGRVLIKRILCMTEEERLDLWTQERSCIEPYTYLNLATEVTRCLQVLHSQWVTTE